MKIINPSVEYIPQVNNTFEGICKQIEKAGRTCYKSEDAITDTSYEKFIELLINRGHNAMLEHGTVYMTLKINSEKRSEIVQYEWFSNNEPTEYSKIFGFIKYLFDKNPYSVVNIHYERDEDETVMCITTNYRVILENNWKGIMKCFISEPTQYHTPRITLKFTTNIGVTREGNRMRANSIAEESTRYCNYTKDKFGSELNITLPVWISDNDKPYLNDRYTDSLDTYCYSIIDEAHKYWCDLDWYLFAITACQEAYKNLIRLGWKPQQAREILPLATKSEVVYTAFPHQWKHFFDLRLFGMTGKPHPNMEQIAEKARDILIKNNLWNLIYNPNKNC